jgi:hypothetical protein
MAGQQAMSASVASRYDDCTSVASVFVRDGTKGEEWSNSAADGFPVPAVKPLTSCPLAEQNAHG